MKARINNLVERNGWYYFRSRIPCRNSRKEIRCTPPSKHLNDNILKHNLQNWDYNSLVLFCDEGTMKNLPMIIDELLQRHPYGIGYIPQSICGDIFPAWVPHKVDNTNQVHALKENH